MQKKAIGGISTLAALMLALTQTSAAQGMPSLGSVFVPQSSMARPGDAGVRAHTHVLIRVVHPASQGQPQRSFATGTPPFPDFAFETPASLGCVYQLVSPVVSGCNPNTVTVPPSGGSKTIAIVDAYDDPNAESDLNTFSGQFGLPAVTSGTFSVVFATGTNPGQDPTGGWEAEEALDIEMVHAMAPNAKIILVEAASDLDTDLYNAVTVASGLVAGAGGGEVSMSWGTPEYDTETSDDTTFTTSGIVYIASTGDSPGTEYPSVSPNVIAAGGASIRRGPLAGNLKGQGVWQDTGDGPSLYETRPAFQNGVVNSFPSWAQGARNVPDLSFDADPDTGVWIYDSIPTSGVPNELSNWYIYGGTSVAAQALAGIINVAGHFPPSSARELRRIYNHGTVSTDYYDITSGNCGPYDGFAAVAGWDYCSGVGTPIGYIGK